jgi:hypothetical protein
MRSNNV